MMELDQRQIEIGFSPGADDVESSGATEAPEKVLRSLGVPLGPDNGQEFVYTDKGRARWSGMTHAHNTSIYHGLSAGMYKCVEDWVLALGDSRLSAPDAGRVGVYPHKLVRHYEFEKTREEIFFCEGTGALVVLYTTEFRGHFRFAPRFDVRHIWKPGRHPYRTRWDTEHNLLLVTNPKADEETGSRRIWVGVSASEPMMFVEQAAYYPITYPQDERRGVMKEGNPHQAGLLKGRVKSGRVAFVMAAGDSEEQVRDSIHQALFRRQECYVDRCARMSGLVERAVRGTGDDPLERALRWAALSLDSLVMNQQGRGIYAGLPWFPNYWSRDTFISLPALLCLGRFEECREILVAAAEGQCEDFRSPDYGRLPNLVTPGEEPRFNTADGTWWFVLAAHAYLRHTGDVRFAHEILSYLICAIEGEVKKRTDGQGFSVHGDAETWMDAALDGRAWTPRGNRAVEVQVLWHAALMAAAEMAGWAGERGLSEEWRRLGSKVGEAFGRGFWDSGSGCLFDHLNEDGSGDRQARPNQIFALAARAAPLLSFEQETAVLESVLDRVVFAHGVASLAPEDPDFCPRHIDLERYPFDQAYHNGDVWVWLSGPVISALIRHGRVKTAWAMVRTLVELTLDEGAVGTLPELRNAVPPAEGEANVEGTVSQAWSLAEFVRPFYQDVLGLHPDMVNRRLTIEPALPESLPGLEFDVRLGDVELLGRYEVEKHEKRFRFNLEGSGRAVTLRVRVRVPGARVLVAKAELAPEESADLVASLDGGEWRMTLDGDPVSFDVETTPFDIANETVLNFRVPEETRSIHRSTE